MIRDRKLRTEDGTVVSEGGGALAREDLELNKVFEDIGNLTEDQREVMNNASTFTDGRAEEIERLQARVKQLEKAWRLEHSEVTMLRERLTRWAKVITEMYEQVTQEILF